MAHPSTLRPRQRAAVSLLFVSAFALAACSDDSPTAAAPIEAPAVDPSLVVTGGTIGDLGTLGGSSSAAFDINEAGHVVGYAATSGGKKHAFIHTPAGGMRDLGTIGNVPGHESEARAVNRDGWVTGHSQSGEEGAMFPVHAFRWRPATGMQDLGSLGGLGSYGIDINDSGQVVGWSWLARDPEGYEWRRAFIHNPGGTMQDLGTLGGNESFANAINVQGVVVGKAQNAAGDLRPFRWTAGGGMQDLAPNGGGTGEAIDINDAGQIVARDGVLGAFVYTPGKGLQQIVRTDIAGASIIPTAINNKGEVAGWMYVAGRRYACRWTPTGGVQNLGTLGGSASEATDINDGGDVTGYSQLPASYDTRAFIWTPGGGMREMGILGPPAWYWYNSTHYGVEINNKREVAGVGSDPYGQPRAARWVSVWTETAPEITSLGGPYVAYEGANLRFSPAILNRDGDVLTYEWAFGNGLGSTARAPGHKYADQGLYAVRLIIRDPGGLADTSTVNAEIRNAPPTGVLQAPFSAVEGRTFTLGFSSVTDPGPADQASLVVSINCGTTFRAYSASLTGTCNAPRDQDTITILARVKDKDGAIREYSRVIPVNNAVPVAQLAAMGSTTIAPGGSVTISASFSDFGTTDAPWSWRITWGDGTATPWTNTTAQGALANQSHAYAAPGTYAARLWVKDKDGAQGFSTPVNVVVQ